MQLYDDSKINAFSCRFADFKESAIRLETEKYVNTKEGKSGSLEVLENVSEIMIEDCIFENNTRENIVIKPNATAALAYQQEPMMF